MGKGTSVFVLLLVALATLFSLSARSASAEATSSPSTDPATAPVAGSLAGPPISFDKHVRPILAKHCFACHGGVKQAGGLSMIWEANLFQGGDSGPVVIPRNVGDSELFKRIISEDEFIRMPPPEHGEPLSSDEIKTFIHWIDQGANWEKPWAFEPINQPDLPETTKAKSSWPRTEIDQFILARMKEAHLFPAPEANDMAWLRRVSFDLIGLPPSKELRDTFQTDLQNTDFRETAYERAVDRLLSSPHFGERWASAWLDLARYADTSGYEKDSPRDVWPYRDWVIRAFDDDTPYNEFLVEQLAGDLLPNATISNQLATTFHRNTQTNLEGGTDDEEFRIAAVLDRVDTTWQATQGFTFGCARCHDHPYDPISQEEYYRFYASLNSTQDIDLAEEFPKLSVPNDKEQWEEAKLLDDKLATIRQTIFERGVALAENRDEWHGLPIDQASSTGQTELTLKTINEAINGSASDGIEVIAEGTITDQSQYTISAPVPIGTLTAIRIDALPIDLVEALKQPELGFILSRLRLFIDRADGSEQEVFLQTVFCDDPSPFFSAEESITDSSVGWSAYSRLIRPHWAVFVLDQQLDGPIQLAKGDRLRLILKHSKSLDGQGAIVVRRFRVAYTDNPEWDKLRRDEKITALRTQAVELQTKRDAIPSTATPVLAELPTGMERPSYLFERGNFLVKGKPLQPGVPAIIGSSTASSREQISSRLEVAKWIASKSNPLTARVWVNRVWSELFGHGLVTTLDDFGTTGIKPSHPKLLDYLAIEFMNQHRWQLKPLLREIVLSATYRQDAKPLDEAENLDPTNQWLSHGPRKRLRAEMIRDQALVLSGKFNPKRFGKPVMPYQPEGVWESTYSEQKWQMSEGDDRYRRAIYTFWKRSAAYPSMRTFDAPTRELCTAERPTTNTPLQALALLNDPAYHELAGGFAEQILNHATTVDEQVAWGYTEATGQVASSATIEELSQLYRDALLELASEKETDNPTLQAMTIVASALLNLDATLNY